MFRACSLIAILITCAALLTASGRRRAAERPLRVALIGFGPSDSVGNVTDARAIESTFKDVLARQARVLMIEPSRIQAALAGIKYDGSINLSKDEARRIGAAIGCDFFITGKAEVFARSQTERQEHQEAFVGVMIVDGRSGALAVFDFLNERGPTKERASAAVIKSLDAKVASYVDRMSQFLTERERLPRQASSTSDKGSTAFDLEKVEDMTDLESAAAGGFTAPEFFNRVKPEYTEEANLANVTATVEARVVFRANKEVGEIEITRWGGFGLDESAERAIRQLRFNPATRDGRPVSVRAMVRYNFRRTK